MNDSVPVVLAFEVFHLLVVVELFVIVHRVVARNRRDAIRASPSVPDVLAPPRRELETIAALFALGAIAHALVAAQTQIPAASTVLGGSALLILGGAVGTLWGARRPRGTVDDEGVVAVTWPLLGRTRRLVRWRDVRAIRYRRLYGAFEICSHGGERIGVPLMDRGASTFAAFALARLPADMIAPARSALTRARRGWPI